MSRRNRSVLQAEVTKACRVSASVIRKLEQMEFVASDDVTIFRAPKHYMRDENTAVTLNEAQNQAYEVIRQDVKLENSQTYLLHGVTGSGKTEVYMKLAEDVLDLNKQCLVLVPEISLTPQIVSKFVNRFSGQVAVFHSKLSLGERFDQWKAVKRGELNIIIGARSALFAPVLIWALLYSMKNMTMLISLIRIQNIGRWKWQESSGNSTGRLLFWARRHQVWKLCIM